MELILIAAIDENYAIGRNNTIPWNIPNDIARFKELTLGYPIIMGRKTYQSLPDKSRPLPGRLNTVLSRNLDYKLDQAFVFTGKEELLSALHQKTPYSDGINYERAFVIGGQQVYQEFLPYANRLELTHIKTLVDDADTYFPRINMDDWLVTNKIDNEGYSFITYQRKHHKNLI